jgi:hypothetical protein
MLAMETLDMDPPSVEDSSDDCCDYHTFMQLRMNNRNRASINTDITSEGGFARVNALKFHCDTPATRPPKFAKK